MLVYFHGGGMVMGSNRSFEPLARALAAGTDATVVSVDYRLAPENPATRTVRRRIRRDHVGRRQRRAIGRRSCAARVVGDSAGGSLAAAVALACRDHAGPPIYVQVLLYPGLDRDMAAQSITEMPDAPMLAHDDICYMHDLADTGADVEPGPYRIPAHAADLSGLPQAIVVTAECDPIRDWGERYAPRLRDARVQVDVTRYPGIYHGFLMRSDATARGRLAIAEVCALLKAKFEHPVKF